MPSKLILQAIPAGPPPPLENLWYPLDDGAVVAAARNAEPPYANDPTLTLTPDTPANVTWNEPFPDLPWANPCLRVLDQAVSLNGANTVDPFGGKAGFAVSVWFQGTAGWPSDVYSYLFNRAGLENYQFLAQWEPGGGQMRIVFVAAGGLRVVYAASGATRADFTGSTHFVVLNYDGANVALWIDGVSVGSTALTGAVWPAGIGAPLQLGRNDNAGGSNRAAVGYYADYKLWSRALTQQEIEDEWNAKKP